MTIVEKTEYDLLADLERFRRLIEAARTTVVMHPDDVTDAVRAEIARYPLATLKESSLFASPGKVLVVNHGAVLFGNETAAHTGERELRR